MFFLLKIWRSDVKNGLRNATWRKVRCTLFLFISPLAYCFFYLQYELKRCKSLLAVKPLREKNELSWKETERKWSIRITSNMLRIFKKRARFCVDIFFFESFGVYATNFPIWHDSVVNKPSMEVVPCGQIHLTWKRRKRKRERNKEGEVGKKIK